MSSKNARVKKKKDLKTTKNKASIDTEIAAQRMDRDWFLSHPARSHRVRRALSGELAGALHGEDYIVVRQIMPGLRMRARFSTPVALPDEDPPEAVAHAIFDLTQEKAGQFVSVAELYGRIYAYSVAGGPSSGEGGTIH